VDLLASYWQTLVDLVSAAWEAAVGDVAAIPAPILLGRYAPGLLLIGFVLGYALRASISRRRRNRIRRMREGW
jgi:hypothetical protein